MSHYQNKALKDCSIDELFKLYNSLDKSAEPDKAEEIRGLLIDRKVIGLTSPDDIFENPDKWEDGSVGVRIDIYIMAFIFSVVAFGVVIKRIFF
jgi:hypothetical protein